MCFSLRTLLVALTIVCVGVALTVSGFSEAARQRRAVKIMEEEHGNLPWIGVSFNLSSEVEEAYYESYFDSFHRKVTGILIQEVDADVVLFRLPRIRSLRAFRVVDGELTDRGVDVLCRFELSDVEICTGSRCTDKGILALTKIKSLRTLHLSRGGRTDRGIAEFRRLRPDVNVVLDFSGLDMEMKYSQ